ncbi:MAG: hypothetical protein EA398_00350 [Deltaproteobacteria bacterium]|nr:MAG: hypothetical protein EA398_00350 [Deltaproteobacteria bacterium]
MAETPPIERDDQATEAPPRTWSAGRILRGALWTVLAASVLLVVTLVLLTQTQPGRNLLLTQALRIANQAGLEGTLHAERLRGPLLRHAALDGVSLRDHDGRTLLHLGSVDVRYRLRPLLDGRIHLVDVALDDLLVDLRILDDGSLDILGILPPSDESTESDPLDLVIDNLSLRQGRVVLRDARNDDARLVDLRDLDVDLRLRMTPDGAIGIALPQLDAGLLVPGVLPEPLAVGLQHLDLFLQDDELTLRLHTLRAGRTALDSLTAAVALDPTGEHPFAHLNVDLPTLVLDPAELNTLLEAEVLRQPVAISATLGGPVDSLHLALQAAVDDEPPVRADVTLDLRNLTTPGWRARLAIERLVPARWVDLEALGAPPLDADLSAAIRIEGRGISPDELVVGGIAEIGPSRVGEWGLRSGFLSFAWEEETLTLRRLDIDALDARLQADGTAGLDGSLDLRTRLTISELAAPLSALPPELDLPSVRGALDLTLDARGSVPVDVLQTPPDEVDDPVAFALEALSSLRFQAALTLRNLRMDDMQIARAELRASGRPSTHPELTAELSVRQARMDGFLLDRLDADWNSRGFDGRLRVDGVAQGDELRFGLTTGAAWDEGRLSGSITRLEAAMPDIQARLESTAPWRVRLSDEFAPLDARIDIPRLTALGAELSLSGQWDIRGRIALDAVVEGLRLERLGDLVDGVPPDLRGVVGASLSAGGTLRTPTLDARVTAEEVGIAELDDLRVEARLDVSTGLAKFGLELYRAGDRLSLVNGFVPLLLDLERGIVDVPSREVLSVRAESDDVDLGALATLIPDLEPLAIAGRLEGWFNLEGTLRDPRGRGRMAVRDLGVTVPLDEAGGVTWRIEPMSVLLEGVYGEGEDRGLTGSLRVDWPEDGEASDAPLLGASVKLDADVRDIVEDPDMLEEWIRTLRGQVLVEMADTSLTRLPPELLDGLGLRGGVVGGELGWRGPLAAGELTAAVRAREVDIEGLPLLHGAFEARIADNTRIEGRAGYADRDVLELELSLEDSYASLLGGTLRTDGEVRGRLLVQDVRLAHLVDGVTSHGGEPGTLQGYLDVFGTVDDPRMFGRLALRELLLFDERESMLGVEVRFEDQVLSSHVVMCDGSQDAVEVTASLGLPLSVRALLEGEPLPGIESWPVEVALTMNDTDMVALFPRVLVASWIDEAAGRVSADVRVGGVIGDPRIDGSMSLRDVSLGIIPLARTLDEVRLDLAFDNERVRLSDLLVRDGSGRLTGQATVLLEDWFPTTMALELESRDFLLADPSGAGVFYTGSVRVNGNTEAEVLALDVVLENSVVEVPDDATQQPTLGPTQLGAPIFFIGEDVDASQVGQRDPRRLGEEDELAMADLNVDVRVRTRGRNELRHSLATIQFAVDLGLELRGNDITTSGAVTLPSGEIRVAGRRLDIERGRIAFQGTGDEAFDPSLDIRAVHVLSSGVAANLEAPSGERATITVVVSGVASDPTIALQSDPAMSEEDIIFVLLTGRPRMEGDGEADAQSQVLATAGSLALGLLSDRISGDIPIDTLRIEGDAQEGQAISRVEGGKYLSENVYLSGTYIPGAREDENDFEIGLEWIIVRFGNGSIRIHLRGGNAQKGSTEVLYNFVVP